MELRQTGSLEAYIQDFDVLWNKADISERQAMVFFIRGLEIEIKNPVKMFDPKALRQAYNLARLQDNTLSYRRSQPQSHQTLPKYTPQCILPLVPFKQNTHMPYSRQTVNPNITTFRQPQQGILPTPTQKPTRTIRPRDLEEIRAKGLCFWCDE